MGIVSIVVTLIGAGLLIYSIYKLIKTSTSRSKQITELSNRNEINLEDLNRYQLPGEEEERAPVPQNTFQFRGEPTEDTFSEKNSSLFNKT